MRIKIAFMLLAAVVVGLLLGDAYNRYRRESWLGDAFSEYERCGQSGRDCYYSPSRREGVLQTPPAIDISQACVRNPRTYAGIIERDYKKLIVRCSTRQFVGEYKIETQLWQPERLGHFMSTFGMADAATAAKIPFGEIVSPGESRP